MSRRASILVSFLLGVACDRGSANRANRPLPNVRVAAPADLSRGQLEAGSLQGVGRHIIELVDDSSGSHELAASGLVLNPLSGRSEVAIEFVPAPLERHWRLLNGGHVDVVPQIRQHEIERLSRLSTIETMELPPSNFVALYAKERSAGSQLSRLLDVESIVAAVCGEDCRARYPIEPAPATEPEDELPESLELIYLEGADAEALGARVIAHQLLDHGIDVDIEPLEFDEFNRRGLTGDFDLMLTLAPTSPEAFPRLLELMGIPEDQVASRLIPLWNLKLYAAYDTSICNVEPDSVTSWSWLAKVRPCEAAP